MSSPYGPPQGGPGGPGFGQPGSGPQQWGPGGPGGPGPGPGGPGPGGPGPGGPGPGGPGGPAPYGAPAKPMDLGKLLPMVVGGLGLLNFIWGFLPLGPTGFGDSVGVFESGAGWAPALFLIGGLIAAAPLLPKGEKHSYVAAAVSVAAMLTAFFTLISLQSSGVGLILLLIFGLLQAAAAVVLWLVDAGIMKQGQLGAPVGFGGQVGPQHGPQGQPHPGHQGPPPAGGQPFGAPGGFGQPQPSGPSFGGAAGAGGASYGPSTPEPSTPSADGGSFDASRYSSEAPEASSSFSAPSTQPDSGSTGSSGLSLNKPDDEDNPDVTQQVRF